MSETREQKLRESTESWPAVAKRLCVRAGTLNYLYAESAYEAGILRGAEEERESCNCVVKKIADRETLFSEHARTTQVSLYHDAASKVSLEIAEAIRARGKG